MSFVIGPACIDVMDMTCVEQCPVDCIYEGVRKLYIHPSECIDCGACEATCPVEAITHQSSAPVDEVVDARVFFESVLAGRQAPLHSPGGAATVGPVGADTARVSAAPPSN